MLLKNISKRLIVVEDKKIIPGYSAEVSDTYASHPIVIDMIANKELEKVENCKVASIVSEGSSNSQGPEVVDFKNMKVSELEAYASEHGIDLTGAKTKEEKIALIKANESN